MKLIVKDEDFKYLDVRISKIISREKSLPEKIFSSSFNHFLFTTFDDVIMAEYFFERIKLFLKNNGEDKFWIVTLNPDPKDYYHSNFGFYGAVEFTVNDTSDDYLDALGNYPKESPADALMHNSDILVCFSPNSNWCLYADRNTDIALFGFKSEDIMASLGDIYGNNLLGSVMSAADYAYGDSKADNEDKRTFCNNYK